MGCQWASSRASGPPVLCMPHAGSAGPPVMLNLSCCIIPVVQGKQAVRDEQGVLSCLKRALKIANAAQQQVRQPMSAWALVAAGVRARP